MPETGEQPPIDVLLIASGGGHLVQALRIARVMRAQTDISMVMVTPGTVPSRARPVEQVVACADFSRETAWRMFKVGRQLLRLLRRHRPRLVITTGAAPGLVGIACARYRGIPAVWVDSLANARRLSLSGRLAITLGADVLSQWPAVAEAAGVRYEGNVL